MELRKREKKRKNVAGSVLFGGVQVPSNRVQSQVYKGRFCGLIVFLGKTSMKKKKVFFRALPK